MEVSPFLLTTQLCRRLQERELLETQELPGRRMGPLSSGIGLLDYISSCPVEQGEKGGSENLVGNKMERKQPELPPAEQWRGRERERRNLCEGRAYSGVLAPHKRFQKQRFSMNCKVGAMEMSQIT